LASLVLPNFVNEASIGSDKAAIVLNRQSQIKARLSRSPFKTLRRTFLIGHHFRTNILIRLWFSPVNTKALYRFPPNPPILVV
jgi:hypothetical protein